MSATQRLSGFTRLFCRQHWIGGWCTRQSHSYFSIKLPHDWWLWGVDVQLESDIDANQKHYFHSMAEQLQPGGRVILCLPQPAWIYGEIGDGTAERNLQYLEEFLIRKNGASLEVIIAGDLHHYSRYQQVGGQRQLITSGGGGAFMHGTHNLPDKLRRAENEECVIDEKKYCYPDPRRSISMVWHNLLFPIRNVRFSLFMGGIYLLFAWLLLYAAARFNGHDSLSSFIEQTAAVPFSLDGGALVSKYFLNVLSQSPEGILLALLLVLGIGIYSEAPPNRTITDYLVGVQHGLSHLVLSIVMLWGFSVVNKAVSAQGDIVLSPSYLLTVEMLLGGTFGGGLLVGCYLLATNRLLGLNRTTAFSSLRVADYKSFLRLHIAAEGLTIYPIGVDKVPRQWRFVPEGAREAPWFEPKDRPIVPRLLEQPVRLHTTKSLFGNEDSAQ